MNFLTHNAAYILAHNEIQDVTYDNCNGMPTGDGVEEMWYVLERNSISKHLSPNVQQILYYFEEVYQEEGKSDYTWTTNLTEEQAVDVKNTYAESMKKWNNVYFYTYNSDGTITKNRLINVIEGTRNNHNLSIYPAILTNLYGTSADIADTSPVGTADTTSTTMHKHYAEWFMRIDVIWFAYVNDDYEELVRHSRERTGAHELGHILGLLDVDSDNLCNAGNDVEHHEELLMGYGDIAYSTVDITYKDIAGVAITRGFHTDDHKWLNCGTQSGEQNKLICSICNGVKYVTNLDEYTHDTYGSCNENHDLSSGNMMAVACYGTKDYYKCKYCRYVAPFESNVEQNYLVDERVDATQHTVINNVTGLTYTTYASHSYNYSYESNTTHKGVCLCGDTISKAHWVKRTELINNRYGRCLDCGALIDLGGGFAETDPFNGTAKVSVNGSYLLPNGIAVIADEDVEAYLNGTLVFYDPDDLPVTQ